MYKSSQVVPISEKANRTSSKLFTCLRLMPRIKSFACKPRLFGGASLANMGQFKDYHANDANSSVRSLSWFS